MNTPIPHQTQARAAGALEACLVSLAPFSAARRRRVRELQAASRAETAPPERGSEAARDAQSSAGVSAAIGHLREATGLLRPVLHSGLDDALARLADADDPLAQSVIAGLVRVGFSDAETKWLLGDLRAGNWRLASACCGDGGATLSALLDGFAVDGDPLDAGFVKWSGHPQRDARAAEAVLHLRSAGFTASVFHVMVLTMAALATCSQPQLQAA